MLDLNLCYRNFVVDDCEIMFHSVLETVPSFHDEEGNLYCAAAAFQRPDADLARDPLLTNHRSTDATQLAMFGTLVVAGSTPDHIRVLIPDTVGTMVNADSPLALHVVGLRLGTPVDLSSSLPPADLDRALCDNSVDITLTKKSGQELHNDYVITDSPAFDELGLFFRAAVRELVHAYLDFPRPRIDTSFAFAPTGGRRLRGIARLHHECPSRHTPRQDPEDVITGTERLLGTLRLSLTLPTSSVVTTMANSQSPVEQMTDLLSSESDHTQLHVPLSRGAVPNVSLASTDLLNCCR